MHANSIATARYLGDLELLDVLRRDEVVRQQLQRTEMLRKRSRVRARLLSDAVRVNVGLIPNVAQSFERVRSCLDDDRPLEAYVFAEPSVHAFVTEASNRYIVAVSSGAVNLLSAEELEFVIGHELGHAAFGHLDVAADAIIELGPLDVRQRRLVRAWQRAAEISADRAGLRCCDSLEVAATALFKTVCGLTVPGMAIEPREFAAQWDRLVEEVLDQGNRDHWQLAHPFPPLRMKALLVFWQHRSQREVDAEIGRLLAYMDSGDSGDHGDGGDRGAWGAGAAGTQQDPLLSRFSFWGAVYVSLASGPLDPRALETLERLAPPGVDLFGLLSSPGSLSELCLENFREARRTRREKLSAAELHRIASVLVDFAADGGAARSGHVTGGGAITARTVEHLQQLGKELGLGPAAMRLLVAQRLERSKQP
jgi:Zn-dependent protease with chaperone function